MRQNHAEFANFLCHFGRDKVLLDYAESVVLPAFTDDSMIRSRGSENPKHYYFYDVGLEIVQDHGRDPILGISGRFVKDVSLVRTQVFDKTQGLIEDYQTMDSSPSSFFLLVLNNHQLAFYPETSYAPTISEFQSTVRRFFFDKYEEFIDAQHKTLNDSRDKSKKGSKVTKKKLREDHPPPNVDIVPLANSQSIRDFVLQFDVLKRLEFRLLRPNPTFDAEEAFGQVRGVLSDLGADNAKLTTSNVEDGLNKEAAVTVINQAALGGNQEVSLQGVTYNGTDIRGSNEDFKATVPVSNVDGTRRGLVEVLYTSLLTVVAASAQPAHGDAHKGILRRLASIVRDSLGDQ